MNNNIARIQNKICSGKSLIDKSREFRSENKKLCFTNGCFDILHLGHVMYLAEAASLGNHLIVGVNSDRSVKSLDKSPDRPINSENSRAFLIAAIEFVDLVVVFDEDTPETIIQNLMPDILVKGGDYDPQESDPTNAKYIVGRNHVLNAGGKVQTIDLVEGYSTTEILKKLNP